MYFPCLMPFSARNTLLSSPSSWKAQTTASPSSQTTLASISFARYVTDTHNKKAFEKGVRTAAATWFCLHAPGVWPVLCLVCVLVPYMCYLLSSPTHKPTHPNQKEPDLPEQVVASSSAAAGASGHLPLAAMTSSAADISGFSDAEDLLRSGSGLGRRNVFSGGSGYDAF